MGELSDRRRHPWHVAGHMITGAAALVPLALATLLAGTALYHYIEKRPWSDAFLNAAMILGGMGPVDRLQTTAGKWLAAVYALFCGLFFIVLAGVMLAPVLHHGLQRFHLEQQRRSDKSE